MARAKQSYVLRPGTRFACAGDGLCCSDIHALGPLSKAERARVEAIDASAIALHPRLGLPVLAPTHAGRCTFLEADGACRIHRDHGADAKPSACRRFPLATVETLTGLRVWTSHRCPCRTMGERPELGVADVEGLPLDDRAPARIRLTQRRKVGFSAYCTYEASALALIAAPNAIAAWSLREELPELEDSAYSDMAHAYRSMVDGTTSGIALGWFGDALLSRVVEHRWTARARPWAWAFDHGEARIAPGRERRAHELFADFAADYIFALGWSHEGSLGGALAQLVVAIDCADRIAKKLVRAGAREERAASEAVMVAELGLSGPLGYARFSLAAEEHELSPLEAILQNAPPS